MKRLSLLFLLLWIGIASSAWAALPVTIPPVNDPLFNGLTIPADAPQRGMWSAQKSWPLVAIHSALLPDGTVLTYGTPLGEGTQDGRTFDRWNPLATSGGHTTLPNSQDVNSFCSTGVLQTSGALLISGGNEPFNSTKFNYATGSATTEPFTLASEHWYSSMIMLPDGRSLIVGGGVPYPPDPYADPENNLGNISMTPERYTPGVGWDSLFGATSRDAFGPDFNRWWYPRQWVGPDGKVFGISTETMWRLNPAGDGSIEILGPFKEPANNSTKPNVGPTSTAVMYDVGKILQVGGNGYADGYNSDSSARATTIDINGPTPVVTDVASMVNPRQWGSATVLPTGRVLVTGGTRHANDGGSAAVYAAELWNPATATWTTMAPASAIRVYHSTAILVPNGTVLSAGGGVPGPATNFNAEVYYPPYLFSSSGGPAALADRPRMIGITDTHFAPGASFQIEMADARVISKVAIVGFSSTTHSFNAGQRLYPAGFTQSGTMLTIGMPPSHAITPPGYYLVFAVDSLGVPSRGQTIFVDPPPGCTSGAQCDDQNPCTDNACTLGFCTNPVNGACNDPVAFYPFDDGAGATARDMTGHGNDGSLAGASWAAGQVAGAVRIAGGAQYVGLPPGIVQSCDDLTAAAWVRLTANAVWSRIFDFGSDTSNYMFLTPAAGNPNTLRFAIKVPGISGGAEVRVSYTHAFPLNTWTHVAVVLQGNTGRLYFNGALVATNTDMVANPSDLGHTPNNWLGRSQFPDPALNGSLDELLISCRAFSAQEIAELAGTPCASAAPFPYEVLAQDRIELVWSTATDCRYVRGTLASVSSYGVTTEGWLTGASSLDISADQPGPGSASYYLLRPSSCGSWQTAIGEEPGRDAALP
jgi:hypothetical protein